MVNGQTMSPAINGLKAFAWDRSKLCLLWKAVPHSDSSAEKGIDPRFMLWRLRMSCCIAVNRQSVVLEDL